MAKNVFILGAGASVGAGAPLMKDFLDRASDLLSEDKFEQDEKEIRRLFEFRSKLRAVYANSTLDIRNIESYLSTLEMGITIGGVAGFSTRNLKKILRAAQNMIVQTLELSVKFPIQQRPKEIIVIAPREYDKFISRVHSKYKSDVSFITFNYDISLDFALARQYGGVDYDLTGNERANQFPLLLT